MTVKNINLINSLVEVNNFWIKFNKDFYFWVECFKEEEIKKIFIGDHDALTNFMVAMFNYIDQMKKDPLMYIYTFDPKMKTFPTDRKIKKVINLFERYTNEFVEIRSRIIF